jgi:hypothetical protein
MTFSEEQVEWIVAEVLRRLGVAGEERSSSAVAELRVTQRVVTMRLIEGRLTGVKRVVVNRRAVITPAVKDLLRHRKIELIEDSK